MNRIRMDINCDLGEGAGNDEALMPLISSANIACGFHAGDTSTMLQTIRLARRHKVAIGAHPSYDDRNNFGRRNMNLGASEIFSLVRRQVQGMYNLCRAEGEHLHHVKPHGALYNQGAADPVIAAAIIAAVKYVSPSLMIYGLSGSHLISEAGSAGLPAVAEAFMDRTYQEDGTLTPRSEKGALIDSIDSAIEQALSLALDRQVKTINGTLVRLEVQTICIHGDGSQAVALANALSKGFRQHDITIQSPG